MCQNNKQEGNKHNRLVMAAMFLLVVMLWFSSWLIITHYIKDPTNQGTFGDTFGAVNALFSGLAFAGLIATLLYQKEELKLQREELQQTREELKGQREEFEEQNKTLKRQRFENTFFNMLSLQQEITNNLFFQYEKEIDCNTTQSYICRGREVFEEIYTHATVEYKGYIFPKNSGIKSILRGGGYNAYTEISETNRFDHYFRHLYRIFKYVDTTDLINDNERYEYACIVRSQLSDYELIMLFFNGLSDNGKEKFKPLIEKYAILKNMRPDLLPSKGDEMTFYQNGAYKYSK